MNKTSLEQRAVAATSSQHPFLLQSFFSISRERETKKKVMPGISYNYSSFITLKPSLPLLPFVPQRRVCCQANATFKNKSHRWLHHQQLEVGLVRNRGEFLKLEEISRKTSNLRLVCHAFQKKFRNSIPSPPQKEGDPNGDNTGLLKLLLWAAEGIYIVWLFLLPYAPGDPVWAISSDTVNSLVSLSLNFFFILPLMNSVGIHLLEAPVLHPMSEGLFNFVIGWTFMFAPLLFTDRKRNRYKGSLDVLWGFQMFLTNTFLIPYMAIRLNEADDNDTPKETSKLGVLMTKGAPIVGLVGGAVCLLCIYWALFGRMDGNFGSLSDRWEYLISYLGSDRLAYAFIWDICLYIIFQPWLIGDNLDNVEENKVELVNKLRFLPVVGLVAYLVSLDSEKEF